MKGAKLKWQKYFTKLLIVIRSLQYKILNFCPFFRSSRSSRSFTTEVDNSSQNPVWSTKHAFPNIDPESLIDAKLDVAVWHFSHSAKQQQCLGKASLTIAINYSIITIRQLHANHIYIQDDCIMEHLPIGITSIYKWFLKRLQTKNNLKLYS